MKDAFPAVLQQSDAALANSDAVYSSELNGRADLAETRTRVFRGLHGEYFSRFSARLLFIGQLWHDGPYRNRICHCFRSRSVQRARLFAAAGHHVREQPDTFSYTRHLLTLSMTAFTRLVQSLNDLQIHNVLQVIGTRGRSVIRKMSPLIADSAKVSRQEIDISLNLGPPTQTLTHSGEPRAITGFDLDPLVRVAKGAGAVVAIECGVGDTVVEDAILLRVYGATRELPEQTLTRTIHLATSRSFEHDPKYAIRLLVDIAIRALSPAVNDPTTAVQALDQIEDLLRRLGCRQLETGYARDAAGKIRVTFPVPTWQDYLTLAFDEIRQFGANSIQVNRRLRAALVGLSDTIAVDERRVAVEQYLDHLNLGIGQSGFDDQDRAAAQQEDRQGLGLSRRRA